MRDIESNRGVAVARTAAVHTRAADHAHRRKLAFTVGPLLHLQFEDQQTIDAHTHQVLHVLPAAERKKLQAQFQRYAQTAPDKTRWYATVTMENAAHERHGQQGGDFSMLSDAAYQLYIDCGRQPRVYATHNVHMTDRDAGTAAAAHFLCFNLPPPLRVALKRGAAPSIGCSHPQYAWRRLVPLPALRLLCEWIEGEAPPDQDIKQDINRSDAREPDPTEPAAISPS